MRRAPLVAAGTIAGIAGVLAFPVQKATVNVSAGASAPGSAPSTTTTPTTTPTTSGAGVAPSATPTTSPPAPSGTASGAEEVFRYGALSVTVTVQSGKITHVGIATISETDPRSQAIDRYAVPQLEQEVIDAGSANVDGVSGATFTSTAFIDSLTSALDKLGFKG